MIRTITRTLALLAASMFVILGAMSPANADSTTGERETELLNIGSHGSHGASYDYEYRDYCWDYDGLLDGLLDGILGRDYVHHHHYHHRYYDHDRYHCDD